MRRRLAVLVGVALGPFASAETRAEQTDCKGVLRAITVDNLRVPDGTTCRLRGTRVQGTVSVGNGARLLAKRIDVAGNVQAENARKVSLVKSRVGGSVQLTQGGAARVEGLTIGGNLQLEANDGSLTAAKNSIGGDLQVFQNSAGAGLRSNLIDGNLQCKENSPAPRGGGNVVGGSAEDQCARMARTSGGGSILPDPDCVYGSVTLGDDFEIAANRSCAMNGTHVQGSLKLQSGSSLSARAIVVDGNIQAQGARSLVVGDSRIDGSVQFEQGGSVRVRSSDVKGNVQLVSNDGELLISGNRIDADLQVFQNRGGAAIALDNNTIGGNLQCKQNSPVPTGGGNVVDGNKEDQCRGR
jgi:hypothetical protein